MSVILLDKTLCRLNTETISNLSSDPQKLNTHNLNHLNTELAFENKRLTRLLKAAVAQNEENQKSNAFDKLKYQSLAEELEYATTLNTELKQQMNIHLNKAGAIQANYQKIVTKLKATQTETLYQLKIVERRASCNKAKLVGVLHKNRLLQQSLTTAEQEIAELRQQPYAPAIDPTEKSGHSIHKHPLAKLTLVFKQWFLALTRKTGEDSSQSKYQRLQAKRKQLWEQSAVKNSQYKPDSKATDIDQYFTRETKRIHP